MISGSYADTLLQWCNFELALQRLSTPLENVSTGSGQNPGSGMSCSARASVGFRVLPHILEIDRQINRSMDAGPM